MPTTIPDYQPPIGDATIPPTGDLVPPQSPSGAVSDQAPPYNYDAGISSTQNALQKVLQVASDQQGSDALNAPTPYSGVSAAAQAYYKWE
jgi:hypothetical protein